MKVWSILMTLVLVGLLGCVDDTKTYPKPYGYFRITLPEQSYISYNDSICPFAFDISSSAVMVDNNKECFKSLIYPSLKAGVYFTYFDVEDNINELIKTADEIVYEHHNMSSGIEQQTINFPEKKVYGMAYKLMGEVAVNYVFYVTDSVDHYLAGKLYFEAKPNYDSLGPSIQFIQDDMQKLVETLEWK